MDARRLAEESAWLSPNHGEEREGEEASQMLTAAELKEEEMLAMQVSTPPSRLRCAMSSLGSSSLLSTLSALFFRGKFQSSSNQKTLMCSICSFCAP